MDSRMTRTPIYQATRQIILLVVLLSTSPAAAKPLPPALQELVGTWEARYKVIHETVEEVEVLTIMSSRLHLSGTFRGRDEFSEESRWYFFARVQELTRDANGTIGLTIAPHRIYEYRPPKIADDPSAVPGQPNYRDAYRYHGTLVNGVLTLTCESREECPYDGWTRVFHKK